MYLGEGAFEFTDDDAFIDGRRLRENCAFRFTPGVTALCGCNGSGKTTLLGQLERDLTNADVPALILDVTTIYDDISWHMSGNMDTFIASTFGSEGEKVKGRLGWCAGKTGEFMRDLHRGLERWVLFDGSDSGLSIDVCRELCVFFTTVASDAPATYVIVAANCYEFVANAGDAVDVQTGEHVDVTSYEDYAKHVTASREKKDRWLESVPAKGE